jgi:hypothetical protein
MLAVRKWLESLDAGGHLPSGFDAADGLRSLFPAGLARLSWLQRYLVDGATLNTSLFNGGVVATQIVGADGTGNWSFTGFVQNNVAIDNGQGPTHLSIPIAVMLGFVFGASTDDVGRGWTLSATAQGAIYLDDHGKQVGAAKGTFSANGADTWLRENWPRILAEPPSADVIRQAIRADNGGTPSDDVPEAAGFSSMIQLIGTGSGLKYPQADESGPGPSGPGQIDWFTGDDDGE